MIRLLSGLIAAIVLGDYMFATWQSIDVTTALVPALFGAVVATAVCWKEAASRRRRRVLAACTCFLAASLVASFVLEIALHGGSVQAPPQIALLALLALASIVLARSAIVASRRWRHRMGLLSYYQGSDRDNPIAHPL